MTPGLGTARLVARHLRAGGAGSVLVALLVGVAVLLAALAPRALALVGTAETRAQVADASPLLVDLNGSGRVGFRPTTPTGGLDNLLGGMDDAIARLLDVREPPLTEVTGSPDWAAHLFADDATPDGPRRFRLVVDLVLDLDAAERVTLVDGGSPAPWRPDLDPEAPIEVTVSDGLAEAADLAVGDVLGYRPAPLRIVGIYQPADPDAVYWQHQSSLRAPTVAAEPGVLPTIRASVYLAPESALALQDEFQNGRLDVWVPILPDRLRFDTADELATQVRALTATDTFLPDGGSIEFRSGLPDALSRVDERMTAVSALLALSLSGLVGVLLAVIALGIRSVVARRSPALGLLAARGAGTLQVRGLMALEGLVTLAPVGGAALVVSALVLPGDPGPVGWALPVALVVVPLVLCAALASPRGLRPPRRDLRLRGASRARFVVEVATIGLAGVALWLLDRRGLVAAATVAGVDPLLSATPLLLALAVCVIALRLYPLPLLALQRLLRPRSGAVGVVGSARAVRDPALGFAAALALIVGVAIVVFSTIFVTTVRTGLDRGAREAVGADLQVQAFAFDAETVAAAQAVDGVAEAVPLVRAAGVPYTDGGAEADATIVVADTAALHRLRPDLPQLATGGGGVAVLVSEDWTDPVRADEPRLGDADLDVVGTVPPTALPGVARHWMLVDAADVDRLGVALPDAQRLLVGLSPGADPATVAQALDEAVTAAQPQSVRGLVVVQDIAAALADARSPAIAAVETALLVAAAVALALTVLAIALATVSVAAARNRLLGVLRILGMSTRQLRGVLAWELGPLAITAALVGTALGFALAAIVTAVLDLRPFVGGLAQPGPVVDPVAIAVALLVFTVTVVAAGAIAVLLGRRLAPAGAVKIGDA